MNQIHEAALLNNEAVSLLGSSSESTQQAFRTLKHAIAILNDINVQGPLTANSSSLAPTKSLFEGSRPSYENTTFPASTSCPRSRVVSVAITPVGRGKNDDGAVGSFVFNRALAFTPVIAARCSVHFYSAVIMFNMALTLHLKVKNNISKMTKNAIHLYDMTLSLLDEANITADFSSEATDLAIATLNNKAQICYETYEFNEARHVLDTMLRILTSSSSDGSTSTTFVQHDIEGFLLNTMVLSFPSVAPAA